MRSLKIDRKTRGGRPKAGRKSAREQRERAAMPANSGRRRKDEDEEEETAGLFERLVAPFRVSRPVLILTAGFLLLAIVGALFAGGYVRRSLDTVNSTTAALVAEAGFGIAEVHITGNTRTPPETVLAALGFAPGQSIFGADLHDARARLMALEWVSDADVVRRYPDTINVRLIEKVPFALWQSGNELWVVERSGGRITMDNIAAYARLPLLLGDGAPQLGADIVDVVATKRALSARVKAYQRQSMRRWNLLLDNKVVVKLPEKNWQKELDTLEHLIIDNGVLERDIVEIDLRDSSRFFFVLKGGEKKAEKRGNAA
jgi:cell division protein FtsQ